MFSISRKYFVWCSESATLDAPIQHENVMIPNVNVQFIIGWQITCVSNITSATDVRFFQLVITRGDSFSTLPHEFVRWPHPDKNATHYQANFGCGFLRWNYCEITYFSFQPGYSGSSFNEIQPHFEFCLADIKMSPPRDKSQRNYLHVHEIDHSQ